MSFFDTANPDSYRGTIDEGSAGPRLGFQEAFSAAWDATTKAHSLLAVEQGLRAVEQQQIKKIREAGLRPPDSLDDAESAPVMTMFRQGRYSAAAQSIVDGGGWYTDEMVQQRNEHLKRLQADRPDLGLLTYDDMFKKVQDDAQAAVKRDALPKTIGGHIGEFLGGAAASMDPVSNPLNFSTLAIGGGTGIPRALVQGVSQGAAEAVNLAASDPENILLGQQRTPGEDLKRIGLAAAGGVGADLLFQGAGAALRKARTGKWFADQPLPERPPAAEPAREITFQGEVPPPLKPGLPLHEYPDFESFARAHGEDVTPHGVSREAVVRTALDLDHVRSELNRWDGPAPWEVKPPTETAPFRAPDETPAISTEGARQRYMDSLETVGDVARRLDPELFRQYDRLAQTRQEARDQLASLDRANPDHRPADPILRRVIMRADEQMRDLAPLVTRAYALAEKEWRSTPVDHNTLDFLKRIEEQSGFRYRGEDKPSLTEQPMRVREPPAGAAPRPATVDDYVPLASMEPDIDKRLHVDTDTAAERVKQNVAHTIEKLDEKVEQFTVAAEKTAKLEAKDIVEKTKLLESDIAELEAKRAASTDLIKTRDINEAIAAVKKELDDLHYVTFPDGRKLHLDNDRAPFVHDDGRVEQMSVRDFLREMAKDQEALKAVTTCSRPS